jgi:hypothetical protein
METVLIERKDGGPRRLLRICGRYREGRFLVLELAPQRRRSQQVECLRLVDVPGHYCRFHKRREEAA